MREYKRREEAAKKKADLLNRLESFVYEAKDKLESAAFLAVTNKNQREEFSAALDKAAEFVSEGGSDDIADMRAKLTELEGFFKPMQHRVKARVLFF
jgi:hypothetical protein